MQSPPFPRYLVLPRSKYSPQHHVLKHPQLPFLPQCQRQVSHPYKTAGKIIVLYILIFKFLDSNQEDKSKLNYICYIFCYYFVYFFKLFISTQVFLASLCLYANVDMVPNNPSCHYMLLMQPYRFKFIISQFHILYACKITTATG